METSSKGIEFIKRHEGIRLRKYLDSKGVATIGYGHTAKNLPQTCSMLQANKWLEDDIKTAESGLKLVKRPLKQYEYDAIISLVYNIGVDNFAYSELLKKLNSSASSSAVCKEIKRWKYVNKRENEGLKRRRNDEVCLYTYGLYCL